MNGEELLLPVEGGGLSARGREASESIRDDLLRRARTRRLARSAVRTSVAAAAALAVGFGCWLVARPQPQPAGVPELVNASPPAPAPLPSPTPLTPPAPTVAIVRFVAPEPGIAERLAARGDSSLAPVREIGDDELLALAESTGERYGLVKVGGYVRIVCLTCPATPKHD